MLFLVLLFLFVLWSSQHVNHIAYWAECKPLPKKKNPPWSNPTPNPKSLLFTGHQKAFPFDPSLFWNGLTPAFRCTCVIDHFLESQRLEMVMDDTSGRRSPHPATPARRQAGRQAAVHSNRLHTSILRCEHLAAEETTIGDSTLRCTVEHLAVVITDASLSQQHITSTLLKFTHNFYFRLDYFVLDIRRHKGYFFIVWITISSLFWCFSFFFSVIKTQTVAVCSFFFRMEND